MGNLLKRVPANAENSADTRISHKGDSIIRYTRFTKHEYIEHLRKVFHRNEFINIQFSQCEVQTLPKLLPKKVYGIQIGQQYCSSNYSDMGYLFLMVDMTNTDKPTIKIRTWQPRHVPIEERYDAGNFFN